MTDEAMDESAGFDQGLAALLSDPAVWDDPDPAVETAIVAAITAERGAGGVMPTGGAKSLAWMRALAAVAAVAVVVVGLVVLRDDGGSGGLEVALAPSELAPDASASVVVADTPLGTQLLLDVSGLPPAPAGQYYEAWLRQDAGVGVSAGTFHLRGGDGEIELWAGVTVADYPLITVTVQDEGETASSGVVVLRGLVGE